MAPAVLPLCLVACQSAVPASDGATLRPAAAIAGGDGNAFIGLDDRALANALGRPQMVRSEPPAEVWQYAGADCVVDFYLYAGAIAGDERRLEVAYVEARDLRAGNASAERCVKSLLQWVWNASVPTTL